MSMAFPRYAPLSTSFVLHLLGEDEDGLQVQVQKASRPFVKRIMAFEQIVSEVRPRVFALMNQSVLEGQTSIKWFRNLVGQQIATKTLSYKAVEEQSLLSRETIRQWRNKHFLGSSHRGELHLDAAAAILMACIIAEEQVRGFLPSSISEQEPLYYCYSQTAPDAPWTICPFPLPLTLSRATLLWTPWPTWDNHWLQIGDRGAIRWAGTTIDSKGSVRWTLNREELELWNQDVRGLDVLFDSARALHNQADTELLRLVRGRLTMLPSLFEELSFMRLS